jgi:hypothetical protein
VRPNDNPLSAASKGRAGGSRERRVTWKMTIGDSVSVNRPQTRKAFAAVLPMAYERCDSSNSALKDLGEGLEYEEPV